MEKGIGASLSGGEDRVMNILEVQNLSKKFGGLKAVQRVSFHIQQGEILGLIGPNGAGKTTVFNLVSGFYPPDEGRVFFSQEEITGLKPHSVCRKGMGRTFQIVQPFADLTLLENVMAGAYNRTEKREEAESRAGEILGLLGLGPKRNEKAKNLTLPERKRLELARALATGPKLLLLDEVVAGLNPAEVGRILPLIQKIRSTGITLFMIEHIMKAIMNLSDRIVVLHHGEKIAEGKPSEVANDARVVQAYLGRKFRHA
jgi:branched-chain amino acid transport system ATP-binding protein